MNKHRLYRRSKKVQGKKYFLNTEITLMLSNNYKLNKIFLKGKGLKIIPK